MLPSALCALCTGFDPLRHRNKATHKVQCPQHWVNFAEAIPGLKVCKNRLLSHLIFFLVSLINYLAIFDMVFHVLV